MKTGTIRIDDLQLYLKKGLYKEERLIDNHFSVSAFVSYDFNELKEGAYLNYADLLQIVKSNMEKDVHLLETIASNILEECRNLWPFLISAGIMIKKHNPGFAGVNVDAVVVEMRI